MDDRPAILLVSEENSDAPARRVRPLRTRLRRARGRSAAEAATAARASSARAARSPCATPESALPDDEVLAMFQRLRTYVPTAAPPDRRALEPVPDRCRGAAPGPGQGQVRRLPADAARCPRRGVPHGGLRAALRLGLDGGGAGRREPAYRLAHQRRRHARVRDYLDRVGTRARHPVGVRREIPIRSR